MTPTGIITAILIGVVVGVLGRLVLPGRQPIGFLVTMLVGIVSALIGTGSPARSASPPRRTASTGWNSWSRSSSPRSVWPWSPR